VPERQTSEDGQFFCSARSTVKGIYTAGSAKPHCLGWDFLRAFSGGSSRKSSDFAKHKGQGYGEKAPALCAPHREARLTAKVAMPYLAAPAACWTSCSHDASCAGVNDIGVPPSTVRSSAFEAN
jgi:hypothetical protein